MKTPFVAAVSAAVCTAQCPDVSGSDFRGSSTLAGWPDSGLQYVQTEGSIGLGDIRLGKS